MNPKLLPILLAALVSGCTNLPDGFVSVDPGPFEWRATSAGGVTAGLRFRPCPKEGGTEFWAAAVKKELEQGRAYTLESSEQVSNPDAEGGTAMVFTTPGQDGYFIAVYRVRTAWYLAWSRWYVFTFEAGGPKKEFEKELPGLKDFAAKVKL